MRESTNLLIGAFGLTFLVASAVAGGKPANPPGGGGKSPPPAPDIIYMSDDGSTQALSQAAVRGIALAADGSSGTDLSLQRSKSGREYQAVAWSPDGQRAAWFQVGLGMVSTPTSIMVGSPAGKAVAIYTSVPGDGKPQIVDSTDGLAWGPDCSNTADSVLVFPSMSPAGLFAIRFVDGQPDPPVQIFDPDAGDGWTYSSALAFSPTGRHLAFAGSGTTSDYGVWLLDMCTPGSVPEQLLTGAQVGDEVRSMDWSRDGERLALSVTVGTDPAFPWRDLKIVDLGYLLDGTTEQVTGAISVWRVDLDNEFGAASSEHSPQWGPGTAGAACQRIAFSQSSDIAPRRLYLLDVNDGYVGDCELNSPLELGGRYPRSLDWK